MAISDEQFGKMESDISWIKSHLEGLDGKYAKKWIERVVVFTLSGIGVAIIGALMGTILIPKVMAIASNLF